MTEWTVEKAWEIVSVHEQWQRDHKAATEIGSTLPVPPRCYCDSDEYAEAYGFLQGFSAAEAKYRAVVEAAKKVIAHYSIVHKGSQMQTAGQVLLNELESALKTNGAESGKP